jgi:hypothetical protein
VDILKRKFPVNIFFSSASIFLFSLLISSSPALGETIEDVSTGETFELESDIIKNSPVIQEWIKKIPDVGTKIRHQPSFPTLLRGGYSQFPSSHHSGGFFVGVEDVFLGNTPLTFSADYTADLSDNPKGERLSIGGSLQYYLLPLGNYVNIAPVVGYKYIATNGYHSDGINIGVKVKFALSPQGATDISLIQSFVAPTSDNEVGVTEIRAGYAINKHLRLSTGISWQNSVKQEDSQLNIGLEWIWK